MILDGCVRVALLLAVPSLTGGCLYHPVHYVQQDAHGGVLSIPTNSDIWPTHYRSRAEALMREKCPEGYVIEKEGKVVLTQNQDDGRKVPEHYEYDGALVKVKDEDSEYHIAFHTVLVARAGGGPTQPMPGLPPPLCPPSPAPALPPMPAPAAPKGFLIPPPPARPVRPADEGEPVLPAPRKLPNLGAAPGEPGA